MQTLLLLLAALCIRAYAQFTANGQAAILNAHNNLRSKIAKGTYIAKGTPKPTGSNILKMKWDTTIATFAQNYANNCGTGYSREDGLGENFYWNWTSATTSNLDIFGTTAAAAWKKEFQNIGWKSNLLTIDLFKTGIGHATQMAWAETNLIGCGVKNCGKDTNGFNKVAVVCLYKPGGNTIDQKIYKTGKTCSACPTGTKCKTATGLCL